MSVLFDTCILIDYLNAVAAARDELALHREKYVSVITWMEVLVGATPDTEVGTRDFLNRFRLIEIGATIREEAVQLRRVHRIKLPDAIIWASAKTHGLTLITRNTKDFSEDSSGIRIPYRF
ncbi:MAG: type II toxin-antitoxin system VapC family toxin [Proteobacteria bacterium]|nr:type II toxin-antitoxin system VapC family toxin [Pseudomonadota bacterium]